ncbi:MAG: sodium:solute symporter family protein [Gammaproteobacteria bacterium]|nr:sodium:solute symporter family protein [Gammaproteobacteria bacterium]
MSTETTIFIGVGAYMVLMLLVGIYAARRTHSATEFAVAGRSLPLWLCTATIIATWFGGGTMMGASGAAYDEGLLGVIADPFGAALCLFLVGLFFARLVRRLKLFTFVEFIERRFGPTCAVIASFASLFSSILWTAGMLVAFGLIFELLTGTPLALGILGGALVVIIYTTIGGMLAVALTDFVQMLIIAVGLVVLLAIVVTDSGGWSVIAAQLPENTWRMLPLQHTPERWLNYLRAWLIFGLADIASQSLLQRAMAAKTERVAQNSFYLASVSYLGFGMIPVLLGIIASVTMPELANSESALPALALEHLHPVGVALFVGALLAAIMSSCDSTLLAGATILSTNLLPFVRKDPSDRLRLSVARWGIFACGAIAVVVALNARLVFDNILDANLLMLAAIIVPFILGAWWQKANRAGALSAMIVGIIAWLATGIYYPQLPGDLIGLAACLTTMLVVTPLTQKMDPPRPVEASVYP